MCCTAKQQHGAQRSMDSRVTASLILVPMPTCWPGAPVLPVFCIAHTEHQVRTDIRYGQYQAASTPALRRHAKTYRAGRSKSQGCTDQPCSGVRSL